MSNRLLIAAVLVFLPLAAWPARPAPAAEPAGPSTPAAPVQCGAPPVLLMAPPLLTPAPVLPLAAARICGCGAASCTGKPEGAACDQGLICASPGPCPTLPAIRCVCILPP
jgi:hypothetical protein